MNETCKKLYEWSGIMKRKLLKDDDHEDYEDYLKIEWVETQIRKSCLLSRTIYGGEGLSKTPCPVHEGVWSGIHFGWPGSIRLDLKTGEKTPIPEDQLSEQCKEWYDAGCRCFMHTCGCTTGWQPDEHCGCGVKE